MQAADRPRMYENFCLWLSCKRYRAWVNEDPSRNTDKGTTIDIPAVIQLAREALAD